MSRCFPFPPPGYEKKARIEDVDLPKKHKKKRKKEKRDQKEKRKSRNRDKRDKEKDRVKTKTRTSDEAKLPDKTNRHNRHFLVQKDRKDRDNYVLTENKYAGQSAGYTEGQSNYSSHLSDKSRAFKFVPELGRRIKDSEGGSRNLLGEKLSVYLPQRDDWVGRLVAKVTQNFDEGKTKDENKESGEDKYSGREIREESKFSRLETIRPVDQDGVNSVEKNADARTEGKRSREKQKDKDRQEGKGKNKRKTEKPEQKIGSLEKSKGCNEDDVTSSDSIITSQLLRDSHKPVARMGSLVKRKDFETNGILLAKDHKSINSSKFLSSSDLPRENHRMLKPCQSSVAAASNCQVTANTNGLKFDGKERESNDNAIEIPPALSSAESNQLIKLSKVHPKPPHPDLEHLSQVYWVPKMEEWSDFCDQDWLYSSNASNLKKLKVHGFEMGTTTPHVWAEAVQIDSINICALPYVVPY
ncbi:glutamic acid-rich protein-like isoform X2 [Momordica charantia]|uniref:Glutamic acid-rich protein-like isoform X2 n=1 Tax=Momordica charantia TaxID=3673 RepID=A0A6J1CZN0_MOMCH|nr:glutamic acid-rich protein-like isoform X2 [Momordica charantia]